MNRNFVRRNITGFSILIFISLFMLIQTIKPAAIFDEKGAIRAFGLGYQKKTALPMWLITIVIAIFSYLAVLFYLAYPKIL